MDDITIVYYTRNAIADTFAGEIRKRLLETVGNTPIVSVSHKPIELGQNICVGEFPKSNYMLWKQIFLGTLVARTPWVGMAEDDVVYTLEHFAFRPPDENTFCYDINRWQLNEDKFFYRYSISMGMCVAPRAALVTSLALRFAKAPTWQGELHAWAEPGLREWMDDLPTVKMQKFSSKSPQVMVNHHDSLGGRRHYHKRDTIVDELPDVGAAKDLWQALHCDGM